MMKGSPPPVAIFAYKRPAHLQLCLECIQRSIDACGISFEIYIFCDAPRQEEDRLECERVREVAKKFSCAQVILREKNHGFKNITEGISALCATHGKVIVIEDDVLVTEDFFSFMTD